MKHDISEKEKLESPYVFQRDKIDFVLNIRELPWTERQKEIISIILDKKTKVVFLKGVAGTGKTLLAMYCGLQLLNQKRVSDLVLIRSAVESSDSKLGYLPGDVSDKLNVYAIPFYDKIAELLSEQDTKKLQKDDRTIVTPVNYIRGLHFAVKFVCCDEIQNTTEKEMRSILTRLGEFTKTVLCGDPEQSDLPANKSCFTEIYDMFNTDESKSKGIYCLELTEKDIVRSELCRYFVEKFKHRDIEKKNSSINGNHK